jgi:hypothetical protein
VKYFNEADDFLEKVETERQKGYIICKEGCEKELKELTNLEEKRKLYEEFHPYLFVQYKNHPIIEFESFDDCMDEFFAVNEVSRVNEQKKNLKQTATKKVDKIKKEQEERINRLQTEQDEAEKKAELIQYNADLVDEAIEIIASARKQGISWEEIKNVIKEQKEDENPVAEIIHSLQLEKSKITLLLNNPLDDDEEETVPMKVQVDITMTAYANVKQYFDDKKKSEMKKTKTIEHSDKVISLAEEKALKSLKQTTKQVKNIQQMRKRFWFEKFNWFITSENYLILSGRDAQQNDILIKRYMKKGDIYVHADIHGASSCIIKNPSGKPIPKNTLIETGVMTVCRSSAWNAKIITDAWWVYDYQVSKTAPSGEYLPTGSFMIRGKKNFLQPSQPMMGLAILFKLSDESIQSHLNERKVEMTPEEEDKFIEIIETELNPDEKAEVFHKSGELEYVNLQKKKKDETVTNNTEENGEEKLDDKRKITPKDRKAIKELTKNGYSEKDATEIVRKNQIKEKEKKEEIVEGGEDEEKKKTQLPRGKKSKLKKMKKKYSDQDEEERKIKMKLLGHKVEDEDEEEEEEDAEEIIKIEQIKEEVVLKQKEMEEVSKLMVEENISFLDSEISIIDGLTGVPTKDDQFLYAIPGFFNFFLTLQVCAPYIAIRNYKYKVKLLPGNLPRGKASKLIQNQLIQEAKLESENELNFIKQIPDNLYTEFILGNVKPVLLQNEDEKKKNFGQKKKK